MASHTPQVFRPRPLDIDTPMLVVIQNDPDDEEELKTEKKFRKREQIPIPIPVYQELESYERENSEWKRPDYYIIYHEKNQAELEETVEYEMDSEDERFVHTINDANHKLKASSGRRVPTLLTDDGFEKMIDVLEKEAFRIIHKIPSRSFLDYLGNLSRRKKPGPKPAINQVLKDIEATKPQDDVPCVVCNDEDWDEGNMIVFCDGCDLAVHQTCYGVPQIPRADWFCRRCERMGRASRAGAHADEKGDEKGGGDRHKHRVKANKKEKEKEKEKEHEGGEEGEKEKEKQREGEGDKEMMSVEDFVCVLCGHSGGAMKPTADGKWAHVLCALWLPDAAFVDATIMEPIDTSGISKDRFGLSCEICGTREGCCIQCRTRYCYTAFHPFCAAQAGLLMEMRTAKGRPNNLLFKTHCTVHSKEIRAERGMETTDKYANIINQVCSEEIKMGLHTLVNVPLAVADAVCNFWLAKRQKAKHKDRPLLSRLQMEEDALRHEKKKRSNPQKAVQTGDEYARLRELRRHMDRALIILDVLKKREMYKRDYVRNLQEIVDVLARDSEYNFTGESTPKKSVSSSSHRPSPHHHTPTTSHTAPTTPSSKKHTTTTHSTPTTPHSGKSTTTTHSTPATSHTTSTTSHATTTPSVAKKSTTPTKSTQLSLDSFFQSKTANTAPPPASPKNATSSPQSRILRDRSTLVPAPLPYAIFPTRSTLRRPNPPSPHHSSSSDESLALPHTTRIGKSPDMVRSRGKSPNRSRASRRSKSPAARRSLSPDLANASADNENDEAQIGNDDEEEDDEAVGPNSDQGESDSSENNMVPKRRAQLRRTGSSPKGTPQPKTNSRKRRRV